MTEQLSIDLATDVVYVYGTVNGNEATFTLTEVGVWSAIVPKAEDYKYIIVITAYNGAGDSTTIETTLYKLEALMALNIDWGPDDTYYENDLVRVEVNTQFLCDILNSLNYYVRGMDIVKVDWQRQDLTFPSVMDRVENNIEALKRSFYMVKGFQDKKDWVKNPWFSYEDAIRLEKNLYLLGNAVDAMQKAFKYAGTFNCGQGVML